MRGRAIFIGAAVLLGLVAAIWVAGGILIAPHRQSAGGLPEDLGGQTVSFPSASGATLQGWLLRGLPGSAAIILLHGVHSTRSSMLDRAIFLNRVGYFVLLFDFQAHGESTGDHITFGSVESKDAQAAVELLRTEVPGSKVGVIGVSMGGAAAVLASPPLEVDAMVLEEVYSEITQATANRLAAHAGGWARVFAPLLTLQLKPRLGISRADLCPLAKIGQISAPKLLIAGAADPYTTLEESRGLLAEAIEPKELWVIDGAGHVDLHAFAKEEYESRILRFFAANLRSRAIQR